MLALLGFAAGAISMSLLHQFREHAETARWTSGWWRVVHGVGAALLLALGQAVLFALAALVMGSRP